MNRQTSQASIPRECQCPASAGRAEQCTAKPEGSNRSKQLLHFGFARQRRAGHKHSRAILPCKGRICSLYKQAHTAFAFAEPYMYNSQPAQPDASHAATRPPRRQRRPRKYRKVA